MRLHVKWRRIPDYPNINLLLQKISFLQVYVSSDYLFDFFGTIYQGQVTLLALCDVSAAFDNIDHNIRLERLEAFDIVGCFLQ